MADRPLPKLKDAAQTVFFQAGGEWCFLRTPASFKASGAPTPCVIQCHGNTGYVKDGEADWLKDEGKTTFINRLTEAGIAVASTHATGNHWGRPNAVAANAALHTAITQNANIDRARIGIWGGGLGGALVWNSVTGPLLGKVKAAALQQATLSYESVIRQHKFKGHLLEAYGIPADTPDDAAFATLSFNDPVTRTRLLEDKMGKSLASQLPEVIFIHGDLDENMLYQENPVRLSHALSPVGARFTFHTFKGVGHATYALGDTAAQVVSGFFKKTFAL
ncbi:MAG: hypothetical protein FJ320_03915 [SAR202 cluster bacterium]|nr:hypothetical protein [SAR202 cluster bacterium]